MIYKESGLVFDFSGEHWVVKAFDRHPYYKALSGHGFKGVDFLGLFEDSQLVCMEVKNYRNLPSTDPVEFIQFLESESRVVRQKMEDTLRIIDLIDQYHHRKWLFRLFKPFVSQYPRFFREWGFWSRAKTLSENPLNCRFVWWIDTSLTIDPDLWQALAANALQGKHPLEIQYPGLSIL